LNKARVRTGGLAAQVYWEGNGGFERTVLFAPGIPYVTDREAITPLLVNLGFGVVQVQYPGTYDSEGPFEPEGCAGVLLEWERILSREGRLFDLRGEAWIKVGGDVEVVAAHSFGTYAAAGAIIRGLRPRVALMLSPMFEFGSKAPEVGLQVDLDKHVRHISRALPLTFRMHSVDEWEHFFAQESVFHPDEAKDVGEARTRLYCVVGDQDPSLNAPTSCKYVESFARKYSNCFEQAKGVVVEGGTHDVESLLSPAVVEEITALLKR